MDKENYIKLIEDYYLATKQDGYKFHFALGYLKARFNNVKDFIEVLDTLEYFYNIDTSNLINRDIEDE